VNDRADLARLSGAAGVHVGQDDLTPAAVRRLLGPDAIVGYSTHSTDQFDAALLEPVSYIAVGPVFGTSTKETGYEAVGLELVSAAAARAQGRPLVTIGGITLDRVADLIAAGTSAVAVIADLLAGNDPAKRVAAYIRVLNV
jgi:thiamine-phosphate pyrophosphorylase